MTRLRNASGKVTTFVQDQEVQALPVGLPGHVGNNDIMGFGRPDALMALATSLLAEEANAYVVGPGTPETGYPIQFYKTI